MLDQPLLSLLSWNWEKAAYTVLLAVAFVSRFYKLGVRAMSHDESLHALYSWQLYAGQGYEHNPMMHGPFLFHITAFFQFLFGANDATTRFSAAVFGVILVGLCWFLRPWIGRLGAFLAAVMVTASPSLLYYSRYIRHDIFAATLALALFLVVFHYNEVDQRDRWLYLAAALLSLLFTTKEVAYIYGAILGSYLILLIAWQWRFERLDLRDIPAMDMAMLLGTLIFPLLSAFAIKMLGWNPTDYGIPQRYRSAAILLVFVAASMTVGWYWLRNRWLIAFGVFLAIFLLFFTTFFTNGKGIYTGSVGALGYWLEQQGVQRGSQPRFYYLLLVPLYEFLPLLLSLGGVIAFLMAEPWRQRAQARRRMPGPEGRGRRRREPAVAAVEQEQPVFGSSVVFVLFLIYWTVMTWVAYTVAGEKMPWLTTHFALPMSLLGAWFAGHVLTRADWREIWQRGGGWLALAIPLFFFVLAALLRSHPLRDKSIQGISETTQWIVALIVGVVLVYLAYGWVRQLGGRRTWEVAFATISALLFLFTIRTSYAASFINYDDATEMLVYAHATPDIKIVLNELDELSRRTVGEKKIAFAYDDDSTWPFEWYFREYPNKKFYGAVPSREALDVPVVIVGSKNEEKVKPYLGNNYIRQGYRLIWWPKEDYKSWTWKKVWDGIRNPESRKKVWDVILYRRWGQPLADWEPSHRFAVYIRRDTAAQVWDFGAAPVPLAELPVDPYLEKFREVAAIRQWGQTGVGGSAPGQLMNPRDVAMGPDGNIYVADTNNHRIQVFSPDGRFLRGWGAKGENAGQFNEPWGIAVGEDGTVYVADTWNHRIQAFDSEGKFLHQWGYFASTDGQLGQPGVFWGPRDIAIDADGNLYVTDTGNKRVQKFAPDGKFLGQWGGGGVVEGRFDEPVGIAIGPDGSIYIADTWNHRIQKFDKDFHFVKAWEIHAWASESVVNKPYLAVDSQGTVYASDPEGYRILVFDSDGNVLASFGRFGTDNRSLALPNGLAITPEDQLLVADADNHRILLFPAVR